MFYVYIFPPTCHTGRCPVSLIPPTAHKTRPLPPLSPPFPLWSPFFLLSFVLSSCVDEIRWFLLGEASVHPSAAPSRTRPTSVQVIKQAGQNSPPPPPSPPPTPPLHHPWVCCLTPPLPLSSVLCVPVHKQHPVSSPQRRQQPRGKHSDNWDVNNLAGGLVTGPLLFNEANKAIAHPVHSQLRGGLTLLPSNLHQSNSDFLNPLNFQAKKKKPHTLNNTFTHFWCC